MLNLQKKEFVKKHVLDTTALLSVSSPVLCAMEVGLAGLSNQTSLNTRMIAAGLSYAGIGYAYAKGRDLSRKYFSVTQSAKEKVQYAHDLLYGAAFNLMVSPLLYATSQKLAGEELNLSKVVVAVALSTAFGAVNGGPMGYAVDTFRDLSGQKECNRPAYPHFIKRQNAKVKKLILVGAVATSLALIGSAYYLNRENAEPNPPTSKTSQMSTLDELVS